MSWKTRIALLVATASVTSLGAGCIKPPGPLDADKGSKGAEDSATEDASSSTEDAGPSTKPDSGDDAHPAYQYCTPDKPFHSVPWAPPTALHQTLCTSAQEHDYMTDYHANKIPSFAGNPDNAACFPCIETNASATHHGPVIVLDDGSLGTNYGGCVANFDG